MQANDHQIGGNHYESSLQHWDFIEYYGIGYLEGCLTKYVVRHHKKNGLQDLQKAEHYLDKLIELCNKGRPPKIYPGVSKEHVEHFILANRLGELEGQICLLIFKEYTLEDLKKAKELLIRLKKDIEEIQGYSKEMGMKNPFGYVPETHPVLKPFFVLEQEEKS
jgi:hypothetical protein